MSKGGIPLSIGARPCRNRRLYEAIQQTQITVKSNRKSTLCKNCECRLSMRVSSYSDLRANIGAIVNACWRIESSSLEDMDTDARAGTRPILLHCVASSL